MNFFENKLLLLIFFLSLDILGLFAILVADIYDNVCYLCELWYLTTAVLSMPNKCEYLRSLLYMSTNRLIERKSAWDLLIMSVLLSPGGQKQVNNTICSFVEANQQTAVPFGSFWFSEMRIFDTTCTWPDWSCDVTRFWLWMDRRSVRWLKE